MRILGVVFVLFGLYLLTSPLTAVEHSPRLYGEADIDLLFYLLGGTSIGAGAWLVFPKRKK